MKLMFLVLHVLFRLLLQCPARSSQAAQSPAWIHLASDGGGRADFWTWTRHMCCPRATHKQTVFHLYLLVVTVFLFQLSRLPPRTSTSAHGPMFSFFNFKDACLVGKVWKSTYLKLATTHPPTRKIRHTQKNTSRSGDWGIPNYIPN